MADEKSDDSPESKKRRLRAPAPTMRQQAEAVRNYAGRPKRTRRIRGVGKKVRQPISAARRVGGKSYYLPMPDNKFGRFMNKHRNWIPSYFVNSWRELKLVTWPGRRETWRLTLAVFIFAIVFGTIIAVVDKGLEELFKKVILK